MSKRGKLEIIRDILKTIQGAHKIKFTPLLRKSNISSNRFSKYYEEIKKKEFIKEEIDEKGKSKKIILTKRGMEYLEKYQTIINFIEEFEL